MVYSSHRSAQHSPRLTPGVTRNPLTFVMAISFGVKEGAAHLAVNMRIFSMSEPEHCD